jgi:hypothetical protein
MSGSDVGAMVRAGAWFETRLGMHVLSIGREADNVTDDCVMEVCGRWLAYRLALRGGWVWLHVSLMDYGNPPELLLTTADGPEGWRQVCKIVRLLEREQVRTLQKPIELGGGCGPGLIILATRGRCWVRHYLRTFPGC